MQNSLYNFIFVSMFLFAFGNTKLSDIDEVRDKQQSILSFLCKEA